MTATGTFSNGTTQNVTSSCSGWASDNPFVLTLSGSGLVTAHNSGQSTITATCQNVFAHQLVNLQLQPAFVRSGTGDTVFDLPNYVTRIRIQGTYTGYTSNFIVHIAGAHVVNELLGTAWGPTSFDGTYQITPGTVEILNSSGVSWTFTEVRQ